jgi:Anti-sigma-K factor rskA/Putative zinc-finger
MKSDEKSRHLTMGSHEEFLELCAAASAGELTAVEQARLDVHLAVCPECRRAQREYEIAATKAAAAIAEDYSSKEQNVVDNSWSLEHAEVALFERLDKEQKDSEPNRVGDDLPEEKVTGRRFTYRPSQIRCREIWMPFAAAVFLALALGIAAYRTGLNRGADVARTLSQPAKESNSSLEAQVSDAGHEQTQLTATLEENAKVIAELRQQLSEQQKLVNGIKASGAPAGNPAVANQQIAQNGNDLRARRDDELVVAQAKLAELQKTAEAATAQRDENARQAAVLEAKVNELTRLVKDREYALDQREVEVAKGQELLEHDRDIRELMGARDLYMADVHDVSGKGTDKTYGRVFYTKGKSLIFYAFDLDAQPGVQNARTFQAWGRRGPDKQQAHSLGIFYEDNVSKKRWVLKADDPKTLEDIDAVFVTVEPNGGSHHPSGKQLLFAYLRVNPNHP